VSNDSGARACVEQTIAAYGQLDSLINNAGILRLADSFEDTTDSQLSDMMRVNFESVFRLSRAALPALEASGRGSIVNTASMVGYRIGMPGHAVYGASKGAVVGLSMTMAIELAPRRVRVNCVAPGVVATDLYVEEFLKDHSQEELEAGSDSTLAAIPIGTYAAPEQVGEVIAFLAGDASSYVTGQTVLIDGGFTGI
jgi:3alpha(or 20beta)-hydroxysteroid dehydrogenase